MKVPQITQSLVIALAALLVGPASAQDPQDRRRGDRDAGYGAAAPYERDDSARRRAGRQRDRADRSPRAQRDQAQRRGTVSGEVVRRKRVDVRGSDRQQLVVLLKTRGGNRVPVDLGSPGRLGNQMPAVGDRITVRGRLVRIGDRGIIVGDELQADGRRVVRIDQRPPRMMRDRDERRRREAARGRRGGDRSDQQAALGIALSDAPEGEGVAVMGVLRGSPADEAGLRPGDRILSVDRNDISSPSELLRAVARKDPGDSVTLEARRDGENRRLNAQLVTRREALEVANDRRRENRQRDERQRDERQRDERQRDERQRDERQREDQRGEDQRGGDR